ncbi:nucleotide exchange factor GrpE [Candidatus Kaiserbacteria bacterium]|nr:nucleotide exchange factor GrpE [Candidatus Kaiserbacteria bacterium]
MPEHEDKKAPKEELEDVDFEPEEELGSTVSLKAKMQKLREELESVRGERQEYLDGWQRCKADSVNLRKDLESRAKREAELLREALVHDIIPALDSFDMAASAESWASVSDGWRSGMERVRDQLIEALRQHGIERYGRAGDTFDHALHEAVEESSDMGEGHDMIVRVLRSGYRTKERVLRPAQVIVAG